MNEVTIMGSCNSLTLTGKDIGPECIRNSVGELGNNYININPERPLSHYLAISSSTIHTPPNTLLQFERGRKVLKELEAKVLKHEYILRVTNIGTQIALHVFRS